MSIFAQRLKELRTEAGLKQEKLEKVIHLGRGRISLYETGKQEADNDTLVEIAKYFDVSIDYLLGRIATRKPWAEPPRNIRIDDLNNEQTKKAEDYVRLLRLEDKDRKKR